MKIRNLILAIVLEAQYQQYLCVSGCAKHSRKYFIKLFKDLWNYRARLAWAAEEKTKHSRGTARQRR